MQLALADDAAVKDKKKDDKQDDKFVDRQLQKALEYLTAEIARAK